MSPFELLAIGGIAFALAAITYITLSRPQIGSALIAAMLSAGFAAYTGATIFHEGVVPLWANHTANLWGIQVWWDLLFAVAIALFFIVPRAGKAGMNIPLWALLVLLTASIGLFAMIARLFWLESQASEQG